MNGRYLVTGGSGSVGSALVKYLIERGNIVCSYDHNEDGLFEQQQAMHPSKRSNLKSFVGDVRDYDRLEQAMNGVDYVYHCAALKHVKLCEYNPFEALKTNVEGTNNVVNASLKNNVKKVVLTSSDKAVNPSSTMGVTKLLSERIITSGNNISGTKKTNFCTVRFGNVWNTAGSVGKIFKRQCIKDENITLTSPDMTRFFVTMSNAIDLCEYAMKNMLGGEIFISNMGKLNIKELAEQFIIYFKSKSKLEIIGAYPGEKLYEELYTEQEALRTGLIDRIYIVLPENDYFLDTISYWNNQQDFIKVDESIPLRSDNDIHKINPIDLIKNI